MTEVKFLSFTLARAMSSTSSASARRGPKPNQIVQEWSPPARKVEALAKGLYNPWRIATEVLVVALCFSWGLSLLTLYRSRKCLASDALHDGGTHIASVTAAFGDLAWVVDEGFVKMAPTAETELERRAFHLQWISHDSFCLRWLGDMRVVEAVVPGKPDAFMLRLGRYNCEEPTQHFKIEGQSIWSIGGKSFVNVRERWHVRVHGDSRPWAPLLKQTARTKIVLHPLPALRETLTKRLISIVSRLPPAIPGSLSLAAPTNATSSGPLIP